MMILDTLKSLVTGLGTSKDKSVSQSFVMNVLSDAELNAMHRSDWLARKIVDIVPHDMTREWCEWQAEKDQITLIEKVEKAPEINIQPKVTLALQKARLLGGSAIYIGMKNAVPEEELMLDRVKQGDLSYLHLLHRHEITPGPISRDVTSEFFGEPEYYTVQGRNGSTVKVHPSRVVRFIGAPILDDRYQDLSGWGDSILQTVYDAVRNATSVQQHIAALIPEAKTDVIYVPGLSKILQNSATTTALTDRFTYANTIKSMFNMVLLEGNGANGDTAQGEKWEQKQISFAQLPDLMQSFLQVASGAADVPVTRLLMQAPSGLGNNGEHALKNYYDNITARQRTELTPAMHRLDEVIIRSALGKRDEAIYSRWAPLYTLSEKEKAETFKMKADAARTIAGTGGMSPALMPIEALSDALVNELVEDGSLSGLEAAIKVYGTLGEQEEDDSDDETNALPPPADPDATLEANDARPRTLYVRRDVINKAEIIRWAKSQGFTDIVPDLHVTIAYSTTPVDWFTVGTSYADRLEIPAGGPRQMEALGPTGDYKALLMTAWELVWRHEQIVESGASWDWPDYQPHISIQVGGNVDLDKVEPYRGRIILGPEIFEEVRED